MLPKIIVLSGAHVAPRIINSFTSTTTTGEAAAAVTLIFLILPSALKPMVWPSGEKNGIRPPSVPGIAAASS